MDVLSEVLRVVRLQGALFYNGEFSSPWSVYAAGSHALARYFETESEHVIVYHLLTEGRASVRLDSGDHDAVIEHGYAVAEIHVLNALIGSRPQP